MKIGKVQFLHGNVEIGIPSDTPQYIDIMYIPYAPKVNETRVLAMANRGAIDILTTLKLNTDLHGYIYISPKMIADFGVYNKMLIVFNCFYIVA